MTIRNLDRLLAPRSVVLIGASPEPRSVGLIVARNLRAGGFHGEVLFVNPRHAEVDGIPCARSVNDLATAPDLAVIATPPATVPGLIAELGAKGTRAVVVITAGIRDDLKKAMLEAACPTCLRIMGPNCVGLMVPGIGLNASFAHRAAAKGDIALLSQSGALITSIVDWAAPRSIGFSHVVSLGDMADADFGDFLDYLAADTTSRSILMYMESLTQAPKFMSAARRAARVKPVIVIKSGRHAAGAKAAMSHTGALAGSDAAYEAAFRRAGVLRVRELDELFSAAELLSRVPPLKGERLTILTNGGGAGVLAADRLADWSGSLATLAPVTRDTLDRVLPATWSHGNPVDIIGDALPERYGLALDALLADETTDAVLVMNCPTALADSKAAADVVVQCVERQKSVAGRAKPVLTAWLGDGAAEPARTAFRQHAMPAFETPDDAIDGFMQLVRHHRAQAELMRAPPSMPASEPPDRDKAASILKAALASGRNMLSEVESKALLSAYAITSVPTGTAATPAEVEREAAKLLADHHAIVVKILSEDITHKSDIGGVRLDLATPREAREAAAGMLDRIAKALPSARVSGFTVQPMIRRPRAHELIVGMSVDETFGPLILFGAGGTAVEVLRDTAQALPPLDLKLAHDLMRQTRTFRLLSGYRDRPPAALPAIAETLVRLSLLVSNHREIRELDINPLLADENGVIALDARVRVADPTREPRVPMSIRPYPQQWEAEIRLAGEQEVLVRPIRPDDEALYAAFFKGLTAEDIRLRFFTPVKSFSSALIARLTQIDYAREMAFVAIDKLSGALKGVVRFTADPDYRRGEFAVLVQSPIKGRGLGWKLMQHLIAYAKAEGLEELFGEVLSENTTMLQMCRELSFTTVTDHDDPSLKHVTLKLKSTP